MSYTLHQFEDAETLATAAAERWRTVLLERDRARTFTVALSGGRIPKALYKAFASLAADDSLEGVHFFWGDERVVPSTDPESNFHLAAVPLFLALKIPESQVHRMITERDEKFAVQQAEAEICRVAELNDQGQPALDLVFLGMGEDGHVASLFPGDTEALETRTVYRAVTGPKPPPRRITRAIRRWLPPGKCGYWHRALASRRRCRLLWSPPATPPWRAFCKVEPTRRFSRTLIWRSLRTWTKRNRPKPNHPNENPDYVVY